MDRQTDRQKDRPVQQLECVFVAVCGVRDSGVGGLQVDDCLTQTQDLLVGLLLLLYDLLATVDGSLKLVNDGIVGGVRAGSPLQALGDAELLAVDLVQHRGQRGRHSVA